MKQPTHRPEYTGDRTLDRIQDNVRGLIELLQGCPFLFGKLVTASFVSGQPLVVSHGLGKLAACIVVRQNHGTTTPAALAEGSSTGIDPLNQMRLVASANCTLGLWFYPRAK